MSTAKHYILQYPVFGIFTGLISLFLLPQEICGQMFVDKAVPMNILAITNSDQYGNGVSTYDFDEDGKDDITLCTNQGNMFFYKNIGEDFSLQPFNINGPGITRHLIWVDYDNDGDLDIFLTTYGGKVKLYKNNDWTFSDVTLASGLPLITANWYGASFGDYDRDGDLDLYICVYDFTNASPPQPWALNYLYRNNGDSTFSDVTVQAGVISPPAVSFQSVWLDYNNDNWPDLFVINDRIFTNKLFENNGDGTFTDVTATAQMEFPLQDVMSNTVGDMNNDGFLDIFMTNTGSATRPTILSVNNGDGTFTESAEEYGVQVFYNSWGAVWIDANNDGWQDLYFTTSDNTPNYFFLNNEGNSFTSAQNLVSSAANPDSYVVAKGDFNNDGAYDMVVKSRAPNRQLVLMNTGAGNNFIKMTLRGTLSNLQAIGSWIRVYEGDLELSDYTFCGETYMGQNSQHKIFGLAQSDGFVDSVRVTYTSGHTDVYYNLPVDSAYQFTEGETYQVSLQSDPGPSVCAGESILLDAGEHHAYLWNTGDTSQFLSVSISGTYLVTTTNPYGIQATDSLEIAVNPLPVISPSITQIDCNGNFTGKVNLFNQTGIPTDTVLWSNGLTGLLITDLGPGVYEYTYTDVNNCSASGSVTLFEPSELFPFVETTPETAGQSNGTILVNVFGGTPPYSLFLNSEPASAPITGLMAGTYVLDIFDDNDCLNQTSVEIGLVLANNRQTLESVKIYPNPATNELRIDSEIPVEHFRIFSLEGRQIMQMSSNYLSGKGIDLQSLNPGMYLLEAVFVNGQSLRSVFVKL